jgi:hypothetical protein
MLGRNRYQYIVDNFQNIVSDAVLDFCQFSVRDVA